MAGASLLTLIDDIATILDDVSVLTKVAAKKTAGVLGDDLALNAQQVNGVNADRELPVVWAVAKGSMLNKVILVPAALAISAFAPWAVIPLLMLGGLFLCFEGVEKLFHQFFCHADAKHLNPQQSTNPSIILEDNLEKEKIKGAIRTDFILSAEIIVITLGTVATASFSNQVMVLAGIAIIMTVGVYGLVAAIVKLDDAGLYLAQCQLPTLTGAIKRKFGFTILKFAPYLMKALSVLGTAAMFLVGGAILTHGIPMVHHWIAQLTEGLNAAWMQWLMPTLVDGLFGVLAGIAALMVVLPAQQLLKPRL
jgi:predicted DNA repair protein MutK